jgi:hypothetical protein
MRPTAPTLIVPPRRAIGRDPRNTTLPGAPTNALLEACRPSAVRVARRVRSRVRVAGWIAALSMATIATSVWYAHRQPSRVRRATTAVDVSR